jgi:hypothetical protein
LCWYVQPGASGGSVGHPVLVVDGAAHDVVVCGSGLVTFLGVGAGVAGVAMYNAIARGSCPEFINISNPLYDPKKCSDMFNLLT